MKILKGEWQRMKNFRVTYIAQLQCIIQYAVQSTCSHNVHVDRISDDGIALSNGMEAQSNEILSNDAMQHKYDYC